MYTDKNNYRHYDIPDKPYWFKNLEKAWEANRKEKESKNKFDQLMYDIGIPKGMKYHTDEYVRWTLQQDWGKLKRKPGRPKLLPEQRKKPKLKRSEQMRQLLQENGITVNDDSTLDKYPEWNFLPNGRIRLQKTSATLSVYQFLQNINSK